MRRFLTITLFVAVIGLLTFAQGCKTNNPGVPSEHYDQLRQEYADLQLKMAELEVQRKTLSETIDNLNRQIANARTDLGPLEAKVAEMEKERKSLEENSAVLKAEIAELQKKLSERDDVLEKLRADLAAATGQKWTVFAGGLKVPIDSEILFSSGKAELKTAGKAALKELKTGISKVLDKHRVAIDYIRIDGHTDSDPIRKTVYLYNDNWELGAARANAVRAELDGLGGWTDYNIYITSFADTIPVAKNDTPANKAKNRRVEIYIVPRFETGK